MGGSSTLSGRLEICYNNAWGTICDDLWGQADAAVACRKLGFRDAGETGFAFLSHTCYLYYVCYLGAVALLQSYRFSDVMPGTGQVVLDNVQCTGNEADLLRCVSNPPLSHNCNHNEDAGVRCQPIGTRGKK